MDGGGGDLGVVIRDTPAVVANVEVYVVPGRVRYTGGWTGNDSTSGTTGVHAFEGGGADGGCCSDVGGSKELDSVSSLEIGEEGCQWLCVGCAVYQFGAFVYAGDGGHMVSIA